MDSDRDDEPGDIYTGTGLGDSPNNAQEKGGSPRPADVEKRGQDPYEVPDAEQLRGRHEHDGDERPR